MSEALPKDEGKSSAAPVRFRLGKIVFWLLLIPLLFFGLSNLWLTSSWGTGVVERKLKERTSMDWEVQGATWAPWSGITIEGATMLQPQELRAEMEEPLLEVQRINVKPYWGRLVRGEVKAREVTVDSPQLTVSVEMLAALVSEVGESEPVAPPKPKKPVTPPKVAKDKGSNKKSAQPNPKKTQQPKKKKETAVAEERAQPARPPVRPVMHVVVKDAGLRVISISEGVDLLSASSIDLDVPLFGEDAKGVIRLGDLKLPGIQDIRDVEQEIVWKRPYLEIEEQSLDLGGVRIRCAAQLGLLRGIPFSLDLIIDPQQIDHIDLLGHFALDVKADKVAGRVRAGGVLIKPMSWQSSMLLLSERLSVIEKHGGHQLHFDELSMPAIFQRGTFSWSSARVIGEDISFLGNGYVSLAGGITSVTRLVSSPELATLLHGAMIGSGLVSHRRWWEPLETPDRQYRDVYITGPLFNPNIDLGKQHLDLPLKQTLSRVMDFIRIEMKEEGVILKPLPNTNLSTPKNHANHQR